jgi:hypothetical protein
MAKAGRRLAKPPRACAELQQAGFGALVGRQGVELVAADCAEEDGVGGERGFECVGGQRRAVGIDGDAADALFGEGEVVAAALATSAGRRLLRW